MNEKDSQFYLSLVDQKQIENSSELDNLFEILAQKNPDNNIIFQKANYEIGSMISIPIDLTSCLFEKAKQINIKANAVMEALQIEFSDYKQENSICLNEVDKVQINIINNLEKVLLTITSKKSQEAVGYYYDDLSKETQKALDYYYDDQLGEINKKEDFIEEQLLKNEFRIELLISTILEIQYIEKEGKRRN